MGDETILIVDDNHEIAEFLSKNLLPSLGYETLVAYNGLAAMKIIKSHKVSLMLLDLQLPDMTGLELLRQLSTEGINIPTILATAHGSERIAADAFRLGVHDYLIKPVEPDNLNAAITRALSASRLMRDNTNLMSQLKEQVSWLGELSRIGQSLTSTLEVDEVLRRIVEAGVNITDADEGFLALLEEKSGQLYLRAVKNIDQEEIKTLRLPVNDSIIGSVLRNKRPLRVNSNPGSELIKVSTGYLVNNLLHVPMLLKGRPIGVISVDNRFNQRPFKEIDEVMLTSLADYATVAIENASLYQKAQAEINERKRIEHALRESETRYALAVQGSNEGLWDWDLKNNRIYYSPRWVNMLGFTPTDVKSDPQEWFGRIHAEDIESTKLEILAHIRGSTSHFENEHRILHKDGTYRWVLSRGIAVCDEGGAAVRMAGSLTDITDRKVAEQKLIHDALHDALTGLPNRTLFMERLRYTVERAKRFSDYMFAVLFLDLDRFKDINDSLGHMIGDRLLVEIAKNLVRELRSTDTVARLGGDEFVFLLDDISNESDATHIADRIQKEVSNSARQAGYDVYISTSIGIVLSSTGYQSPEDVLRDADIAMYRAKAKGKARYEIFDSTMRDRIIDRIELENDLREAIQNSELMLYYQPIISLETGTLAGFEALIRWQHTKRGMLSPNYFIHLSEETGLIVPLGLWILEEACRQMVEWHTEYPTNPPLRVNVNISGKQVAQPDFVEQVRSILLKTGLPGSCLKLEVTESVIMDNTEMAIEIFSQLQNMGIQIEIDDFGVGYSSLSYLSNFPVNALKVDQSFVRRLSVQGGNLKIVQAIVMLAHGLGLTVVAEGVETQEQLTQVKELGCENAQGYYFHKPAHSKDLKKLLAKAANGERMTSL